MSKETAAVKAAWDALANTTTGVTSQEYMENYNLLRVAIERLPDADASDTALVDWIQAHSIGLYHSPVRGWWIQTRTWTQEGFWPTARDAISNAMETMNESTEPAAIAAEGGDDER